MLVSASAQINQQQPDREIAQADSQAKSLNASIERSMQRMDSVNAARNAEQMNRNMDRFMAERKEQQRKQMRGAYMRIGFGVLMMAVLIVGLVRKRKKKNDVA